MNKKAKGLLILLVTYIIAYIAGVFIYKQLNSAMKQLVEGSGSLKEGLNLLLEKSGELGTGVGQLADGAEQLKNGIKTADDGTEKLAEGAGAFRGRKNKRKQPDSLCKRRVQRSHLGDYPETGSAG